MAIQQSINNMLGTVGTVSALGQHLKDQETKRQAEVNTATQSLETNQEALKNDQIEAQQAILAHASEEGLNEAQIKKLHEDPAYAQELRETKLKENRQRRIEEAGFEYAKDPTDANNKQLKAAYDAFRELNNRIDVTRQLKFNIENARQIIKTRGGKQ